MLGPEDQHREDTRAFNEHVLRRLRRLETHLELADLDEDADQELNVDGDVSALEASEPPRDASLTPLWPAIQVLKGTCSAKSDPKIWEESLIKRLWTT